MNTNGNINRIGDYLLVADSLKKFNTSYQSSSVLNIELLVYLTVLRTIKVIEDNDFKNELRKEIEKRRLEKRFYISPRLKHKLFSIYLSLYKLY